MSYEKQTWANGDVITAEKLNHMEDGIDGAGGSDFIINAHGTITDEGGGEIVEWTFDKTPAELLTAWQTPMNCKVHFSRGGVYEGEEWHEELGLHDIQNVVNLSSTQARAIAFMPVFNTHDHFYEYAVYSLVWRTADDSTFLTVSTD